MLSHNFFVMLGGMKKRDQDIKREELLKVTVSRTKISNPSKTPMAYTATLYIHHSMESSILFYVEPIYEVITYIFIKENTLIFFLIIFIDRCLLVSLSFSPYTHKI